MFRFSSILSALSIIQRRLTMPFYAVGKGRQTGVFVTWEQCQAQIKGFACAKFKKFPTEEEATDFVNIWASQGDLPKKKPVEKKEKTPKNPASSASSAGKVASTPKPASTSDQTKAGEKQKIMDEMNAISLKMKKLENIALGLHGKLLALDDSESLEEVEAGFSGKRQLDGKDEKPKKRKKTDRKQNDDVEDMPDPPDGTSEDSVSVYTDGCCLGNGKKGPSAGIGVFWGPNDPNNVSARLTGRQTNNRAEIHAVCRALRQVRQMGKKSLIVHTDSLFLINSVTGWIKKWKLNGWKISDGTEVKNKEDFQLLDELQEGLNVKYVHVQAHAGIQGNEMADQLAKQGAREPYRKKYDWESSDDDLD